MVRGQACPCGNDVAPSPSNVSAYRRRSERLRSARWSNSCSARSEPGVSEARAMTGQPGAHPRIRVSKPQATTSAVGVTIIELPKYSTPAGSIPTALAPYDVDVVVVRPGAVRQLPDVGHRSRADGRAMTSSPCRAIIRANSGKSPSKHTIIAIPPRSVVRRRESSPGVTHPPRERSSVQKGCAFRYMPSTDPDGPRALLRCRRSPGLPPANRCPKSGGCPAGRQPRPAVRPS